MSALLNISEAVSLAWYGLNKISDQAPRKVNIKQLAEQLNASEAHLAKIFQRLTKSGIVKSFRGPAGGFILNKPASEINFLDIYETIDARINPHGCPLGRSSCPFSGCIYNDRLSNLTHEIYDTFKNLKLSEN